MDTKINGYEVLDWEIKPAISDGFRRVRLWIRGWHIELEPTLFFEKVCSKDEVLASFSIYCARGYSGKETLLTLEILKMRILEVRNAPSKKAV